MKLFKKITFFAYPLEALLVFLLGIIPEGNMVFDVVFYAFFATTIYLVISTIALLNLCCPEDYMNELDPNILHDLFIMN